MEYYKKANEAIRQGEERPVQLLKQAGLTATGTAIGTATASATSKLLNKVLPSIGALVSEYVPENISRLGLSKIDPRFKTFIDGALKEGYTYDDIKSSINEKIENTQNQTKDSAKNIIEKYSPDLFSFIKEKIDLGESPLNAGNMAQKEKRFQNIIKKLTEDYRTPFSGIIEMIFGKEMERQKGLKSFNDRLKKRNLIQEETERFNNYYNSDIQSGNEQNQNAEKWNQVANTLQKILNS